jgi:hypothetical protein
MSCEVHVRFCEGVGVRFPRATRLVAVHDDLNIIREVQELSSRAKVL